MPYNNEKMLAPYGQENAPKKIKVVVADISDALEREAFTAAEARLTENKENSRGFKGVFKRIWKHNLFHEYYRQKELFIASQKIKESGNIYVNENLEKEAHDSAMGFVMERFTSEYEEEMIHEGEEKKTITGDSNDGGALKARIRGLIQSYAKGNLSEEEFVLEKNAIFSHELQGIKGESGESITQKGKMYADNILEIARQVRQSIEHGAKLEDLDTDFDIVVGRARSGERTEAQFGRVDRWIEKIQKTKLGRLVNEATIAAAVSVVYAVGTKVALGGARTASKILGPLGFGLSAGIGGAVAGVKESKRLKEERAQHARERARGKTFEKGAERREEMEQFQYETKGASSLAHDLETNLERFKMNPQKAGLDKLLLHLNDVEGRIAFSDCNNVDLIHFSDVRSIEKERTRLDILRAETKVYLRKLLAEKNAGKVVIGLPFRDEATLKDYLIWAKEFRVEGKFSQEKAEKDKAFDKMKRMQVAKAVTKGFAIGLGVGVVAQEVATALNDAEGIFTPSSVHAADLGGDPSAVPHYTSLEYMRRLLSGGLHQNYGGPYTETIIEQNHFSVPDGFVLQNSPSGIDLLHGKDVIFAGLKLKPDGTLTDESLRLLQSQGITTDSVPLSAIGKGVFDLKTVDSANYKLPQGFSFVKNPSGAYYLVGPNGHGGNISIENLKLNPDGSLSQEARDALMQRGVRLGSVTEHVSDARYEEAVIDPKEYVVRHADKFHRIKRTLWYDNNTPKSVFDKNELRLRWGGLHGTGIDSNGRFVMDVSHMTEEGSFHQGLSANAQELMKEGNLKILFSLTRGSQNNVIEVPIDASGHIGIDPNSENGKLLFGVDARGHAVFRGKFMEVAHSLGMKNGAEQMGVLATHEGNGLGPIRDIIDNPAVNKTSTIVEIAEHGTKLNIPSDYEVDWPFVIPMAGRRPLEPVIGRKRKSRLPIFDRPVEMGGYYEGSGSYGGDFSGSVLGNKSLDVKGYFSRVEDLKPQLAEAEIRSLVIDPVHSKELHYIIEKIDEVRNNKEIFDKLHRQYKFQYGSEISEDDFREKIIDTYLKMARNVLIDKAVVGGKPFNHEFYDNSPIIKGINDAQEVVVMYDPPLGDTILDVPIITCLEKYFKLNDMSDKEIVIVTKHAEMFQDFVANNSKIRIVSTKLDKDVRDAFAGEKKRYIINDNKGFRDSSIFGLSEDEFKDEKNVLNVHYSSWTLEQAPEERSKTGNTALKFYYPLPLRVIRNMEMMLGTKLYDNLGKLESFWPPIDQFEDRSRRKREELGLSEDDQILTVSFASSIVPKEYEPSKWLEAINSFMNTAPANLKIVFIQDLNDEKARKYQQEVIDKLPESVRDRSRVIAKLGLDEAPLILKMSKAFISPDTGLGHLASSLGTPNVILHINNPMLWSSTKTRRVTSDTAKRAFRKGERDYGEAWGAPGRFTDYLVKDRTGQMEGASKIDPERITRALNDIFEVQK